MKRTKVFIILVILVLALAAVALQMLVRPRLKYLFAKPNTYGQCVEAGGAIMESFPSQCAYKGQTFTNPDQHVEAAPAPAAAPETKLKTYEDTANKFGFQYPSDIFKDERSPITLPYKNKKNDSLVLRHTVPIKHCDLSGLQDHCTDPSTDISIAFTIIDAPLIEVVSVTTAAVGPLEDIKFGNISAKTADRGSEGEGNVYYFLELVNKKTLMITRSYISEYAMPDYQSVPGYIPFDKQKQIFSDLMKTFQLNQALNIPKAPTNN